MMADLCLGVGVLLLAAAAVTDVSARMVPNWVSVAMAADGLAARLMIGAVGWALLAAGVVFVLATICWRHGLLGGGDVKLLAAASLLVPPASVPALMLAIASAGGVLGVAYWTMGRLVSERWRPRPGSRPGRILRIERHRIARGFSLPYASAIAAGTVFMLTRDAAS